MQTILIYITIFLLSLSAPRSTDSSVTDPYISISALSGNPEDTQITPAEFHTAISNHTHLAQVNPPATFSILSWNIQYLGKTKSDLELSIIADIVHDFDLVVLQEVVAGGGGAQAVSRLVDQLDRMGSDWDYVISDPTTKIEGCKSERYAYLWNKSNTEYIPPAVLATEYSDVICREPFISSFAVRGINVRLLNIHAIPWKSGQHPSQELKYLKEIITEDENWIVAGDLNCTTVETVFSPLFKMRYKFILNGQKTTFKKKIIDGEYLAYEKDNMLFNSHFLKLIDSGIIDTYQFTTSLDSAHGLSDHVPVWATFSE